MAELTFLQRPQRKLFALLLTIYFVWMGVLLVLYFKTVRPGRLQEHPTAGATRTAGGTGAVGATSAAPGVIYLPVPAGPTSAP